MPIWLSTAVLKALNGFFFVELVGLTECFLRFRLEKQKYRRYWHLKVIFIFVSKAVQLPLQFL